MLNVYPNPSSTQVNFEFSLEKNQKISIYVYNSLGQLVRKIVDKQSLNTGQYRVIWDGKNTSGVKVSEGVYTIVILSENSIIKTGKVLMFN
jgi:flagellar hook assembly protein FlgD